METFLQYYPKLRLDRYYDEFKCLIDEKRKFLDHTKGNFLKFKQVVDAVPFTAPSIIDLKDRAIIVGDPSDLESGQQELLRTSLEDLCPWRKGPFSLFGIDIDSEWRSWMKWERIKSHIGSLKNLRILDIGSSNGYYMFKMAADDPLMVLGLEPQSTFYFQYLMMQKFLRQKNVFCLPVTHEHLPDIAGYFDMVFCMGVLYHRKSPIQMLKSICDSIRPGGQLVLENLIIESKHNLCLFPRDRYAKMRNIFFIPDLLAMESWLLRAGFKDILCVDITRTSFIEQRKTKWIQTESLEDFLDPDNPDKTVEGYPAPVRAVFIATAP